MSNKSGTSPQAVPLPTGGGALAGIGETFTPDLFSGTGSFTVPLDLPVGRNGFQPSLNLTYDTGEGNGPFGLGWSMSVPSVRRKTSDGVPRYRDGSDPGSDEDADVFLFSGAEDLVPVTRPEPGTTRYRPRTEGLFARVDRIRTEGSDTWELRTRDGHVNRFGGHGPGSGVVVADPANRSRIFCWPLVETSDPFGNRIVYEYRRDTGSEGPHQWDQLYLDRVRYVDFEQDGTIRFLISVSFVYDDRPDPFSDHRSGFEIRTRLRCRRIEIRTHADGNLLTHSYELEYLDDLVQRGERPASDLPPNRVSLLSRIRVVGHDGDRTQQLPPIELDYTRFRPDRRRFQPLQAEGNTLPPVSLADDELETVDLFGNGLPDIVQLNGSVRFWRNLGDGRFARPQDMDRVPAGLHLGDPGVQFADMNGDGRADLLALARQGYFPLGGDGRWSEDGFVRYPTAPVVSFGADDIRLVDLDGDGVVDALRTGSVFELFFNDRDAGWERVETRPRRPAAEFPDVSFSDPRVKLADLTGDGLQDIVLVQQGRIDYWPYRGHGSWGRRVTMDASPTFRNAPGTPGGFDPRRVLLGDLEGDGLDDIAYVEANRVTCWINRGGNGWSEPFVIEGTPAFTDIDAVRMADVLGTGMDGVLWSNDRVPGTGSNYRFLDLTGGLKPYLLERVDNHRGAVTSLRYASSTKFYLADEARPATRWRAPLPFPVHVIEAVELVDQVSGGRLTNELRYHHGYWDGVERELRGFGMVEQLDTEVFDGDGAEAAFSPPVLTKTWFHLGPESDADEAVSEVDRSAEFWPEDDPALGHVEAINQYLATLPRSVARDAQRSLRGRVLRREVYAADGPALRDRPFTVTEHAYALREESAPGPAEDGRRRIFFPHAVGERVTQWERGTEPMTTLSFTDAFDQYGLSGREIRIAVPRHRDFRRTAPAAAEHYLATVTTTTYARRDDDAYVVDRVATTTTQEIGNDGRPSAVALRDSVRAGSADLRVLDETRNYYDGPGFVGLPLGHVGRFGALTRTETLVLTEEALREGYRADADASDDDAAAVPPYLAPGSGSPRWTSEYPAEFQTSIPAQAGYTFLDGKYYAPQVRRRYDFQEGGWSCAAPIRPRWSPMRPTTTGSCSPV
jgi:Salmonella virulence plasmid 65kDa B protein/Insecticide toxin TcdB middle/N-terminal region/Insecticide toxin TcdB middle/C-terminal region/FG-GAP-like repeat